MRRFVALTLAAVSAAILLFFQNATLITSTLPDFPLRNVDTRTVQMINGKLQTTNPHIPMHDFTQDGRIGVLRRKANGGSAQLVLVRPERVHKYINHRANPLVGANLVNDTADFVFDVGLFKNRFPSLQGLEAELTLPCEKTDIRKNPYVCDGDKDCYDLTLVTRFGQEVEESDDAAGASGSFYFVSVDVKVKVANPKTTGARIESVQVRNNTYRQGPLIPFMKIAEPSIVGDNRLLIARAHNQTLKTTTGESVTNSNIFYSVYPERNGAGGKTQQCDVSQWGYSTDASSNRIHPISHAPFDTRNDMANRYKFARFPFRDSLGNVIPGNVDLGGSYPWMDREAANLFFTAFGNDPFYRFPAGGVQTPYQDMASGPNYFSPTSLTERLDVEHSARTLGVAVAGFWTHGKAVLLDGLINNADYGFRISPRQGGPNPNINVHRKIKLYQRTPAGQTFEPVGAVRERGNNVLHSSYHPLLAYNSSFMGSIENRLNYVEAMKTVTPRDVVWHFGTTRHTDEVVFDDYMTPYALIVAEMTGAIGAFTTDTKTMKYYDGVSLGKAFSSSSISGFPAVPPADEYPVLFQNAATAPPDFMKVPGYGRPVGNVRLEPIAKGGMHGKGAWIEPTSGIMFKVPNQSGSSFDLSSQKNTYVSVFLDIRQNFPAANTDSFERLLVNLSSGNQIFLVRAAGISDPVFDRITLKRNGSTVGWFVLPAHSRLRKEKWYHLAIQFSDAGHNLILNGYRMGSFKKSGSISEADFKAFFRLQSGTEITLGSPTTTKSIATRGWYDEFQIHMRAPTPEERCNYARGTLVRPQSGSPWAGVASRYPADSHDEIQRLAGGASSFACFIRYGEVAYDDLNGINVYAHLKNLPSDVHSVREAALIRNQVLQFDRERPYYGGNQFCLGCHAPQSSRTFKETDTRALRFIQGLSAQNDPRRQPQQPPRWLRGVIPANYFGSGKPARKLAETGVRYEVDQWILASSSYGGNTNEIGSCERTYFTWAQGRYERACGCADLAPEYYPSTDVGSRGQSCYHRYAGGQRCEKSEFTWGGRRFHQACGCSDTNSEYYPVASTGSEGQTCKHRLISSASTRCERQAFVFSGVSYDMTCACAADGLPGASKISELGSQGQACYHRAMGAESPNCHRSRFTWQGQQYERACGCTHPGSDFYQTAELGPNGAVCFHRRLRPD